MSAAATDTNPSAAEAAHPREAIGDPLIVLARSRAIARAGVPARPLPANGAARFHLAARASATFLPRAGGAPPPAVPGEAENTGSTGAAQDIRVSLLANETVMLRRELAERERYQRRLQVLLRERDLLLADLRNTAQARTRAERDRDAVLARLYRAHQAERARLARELHDEAGQQLAWLKLQLDRLRRAPSATEVEAMLQQVDVISANLRHVVRELRPAALAELGLILALGGLVRDCSDRSGIAIEFQLSGTTVTLTPEIEVTIFRLVQEALTNVAKYAPGAQQVSVTLQYAGEGVTLAIEDDGPGLARERGPEDRQNGSGFGLAGMRERLMLVGGELVIESPPGGGTTVLARLPKRRG